MRRFCTNSRSQSTASVTTPAAESSTSSHLSIDVDDLPDDTESETAPTPTSETLSETTLSTDANPSTRFLIQWDRLRHNNKALNGATLRQRHKRVIGTSVKISWIWEHGADIQWNSKRIWLCRRCHTSKKYHQGVLIYNGTTHITEHLERCHKISETGPIVQETTVSLANYWQGCTPSLPTFDDAAFKQEYIDWVIAEDLSFHQSTSKRTRRLFERASQGTKLVIPSSATTLSGWIKSSYEQRRLIIKDLLCSSKSKIHLSFDMWSSPNYLSFCGLVAHFVTHMQKLQTALLALPRIQGSHSGENLSSYIAKVIEDYGIESKLGYFVTDNADNNDTCIQALAKTFPIDSKKQRLRCAGHVINLVVQCLLFGKGLTRLQKELLGGSEEDITKLWRTQGPIGKLHNIVRYINHSDQRRQEFQKQQVVAQPDANKLWELILDGGVRWNSTFYMIERALKLQTAITLYIATWQKPAGNSYDLKKDELSTDDWIELRRFKDLLSPFEKLTKRLEGNAKRPGREGSHGAIWEVLETMDFLSLKLEREARRVQDEPDSHYRTCVDMGWLKLQKYYKLTDETPVYRAAIVLHPAHKEAYFEEKWRKHPAWIKAMRTEVRKLYETYVNEAETAAMYESDSPLDVNESQPSEEEDEFEVFRRTSTSAFRSNKRRRVADELNRYLDDPLVPDVRDPFEWWRKHEVIYPILTKMAYDIFSVPAMSTEVERIFSDNARIVTDDRNRLQSGTIEAIECQNHWLRQELVN